jgi:uncharacterized protein YbjT (DUF2867 family)
MANDRVLVLCATGKVGRNVCRALAEAGFDVYGTSRSASASLQALGATAVLADYTQRADLDRALKETQASKVFVITDYFRAAGRSVQGRLNRVSRPLMRPKRQG